jgi:plasmid maintenance system antidote protein VapI
MPMLAQMEAPGRVREDIIAQCDTLLDAIHLCIQLSKYTHTTVAKKLGVDPGHWTRMMQGGAHFPTNKIKALMDVCRNYAPLQWLNMQMGMEMYENPEAMELANLERRRAQLLAKRPSIAVMTEQAAA